MDADGVDVYVNGDLVVAFSSHCPVSRRREALLSLWYLNLRNRDEDHRIFVKKWKDTYIFYFLQLCFDHEKSFSRVSENINKLSFFKVIHVTLTCIEKIKLFINNIDYFKLRKLYSKS